MPTNSNGILSFFNGTPRTGQARLLPEVERLWNSTDVFVIRADVGEGKSKIAECILRWAASAKSKLPQRSGMYVVPNNVLLDQLLPGLKGFDTLRRQDLYKCTREPALTCSEHKQNTGACCRSASGNVYAADACPYLRDLRRARSSQKMAMTYHALMAHGVHKDVLVVDEAHNLRPFLRELASKKLWKHDYHWSKPIRDIGSCLKWLETAEQTDELSLLHQTLTGPRPQYMIDFSPQSWRGSERECISLIPLDVQHRASPLWPNSVKKIVLMSATINRIDIAALGLDRKRVTYIDLPSSIPAPQRPILYHPVADMRFSRRAESVQEMAKWILEEFLPKHAGEKGLIHATYDVARLLEATAGKDSRLLFHDKGNKRAVLESFLASPPEEGKVLVGSGMYEGLDLRGDLARFQLITQVPRKSVADPAIAWQAENRPEEYEWETVRDLVQATGRVCRGADDYGVTVIADASFEGREMDSPLLPASWKEALIRA